MKFGLTKRDNRFGSEIDSFRKSISDIFDDFFKIEPTNFFENDWSPSIDVEEDNKRIHVKADIPGVDEKDISVNLENNILTIKGERKEESKNESDDKRYVVSERCYGSFHRSIRLPDGVKADKIKAEFNNGVLKINIPKEKVDEAKKIKIDIK